MSLKLQTNKSLLKLFCSISDLGGEDWTFCPRLFLKKMKGVFTKILLRGIISSICLSTKTYAKI